MILTPHIFDVFDRCERRMAFEKDYESAAISPLGLLYGAVEGSMVSNNPVEGAKAAIVSMTQRLDVTTGELSPISTVRHVESMAEVIALALRAKLGKGQRLEPVPLGNHQWQSNLFECRNGLMRVVLASHLDDDSLRSYAHSWQTIGELAALEKPITLAVVVIGHQRGGRRHSHWSKGFQHPVQKSSLRFAPRKRDDGFTQGWKQVWREQDNITAKTWLEQMKNDEVLSDLIVTRQIAYKAEDARMIQARADMLKIAEQVVRARTDVPMRRSSCDEIGRGACPFQAVCYSPTPIGPEDLPHLYHEKPLAETA